MSVAVCDCAEHAGLYVRVVEVEFWYSQLLFQLALLAIAARCPGARWPQSRHAIETHQIGLTIFETSMHYAEAEVSQGPQAQLESVRVEVGRLASVRLAARR